MFKYIKGFLWIALGVVAVALYSYVTFLWPPHLIRFIKNPEDGKSGSGIGPGIYTMLYPFILCSATAAVLTYLSLICGLGYLIIHTTVSFS